MEFDHRILYAAHMCDINQNMSCRTAKVRHKVCSFPETWHWLTNLIRGRSIQRRQMQNLVGTSLWCHSDLKIILWTLKRDNLSCHRLCERKASVRHLQKLWTKGGVLWGLHYTLQQALYTVQKYTRSLHLEAEATTAISWSTRLLASLVTVTEEPQLQPTS